MFVFIDTSIYMLGAGFHVLSFNSYFCKFLCCSRLEMASQSLKDPLVEPAKQPEVQGQMLTRLTVLLTLLIMYFSCSLGTLYMHVFPLLVINKKLYHRVHNFNVSIWYGLAVVRP